MIAEHDQPCTVQSRAITAVVVSSYHRRSHPLLTIGVTLLLLHSPVMIVLLNFCCFVQELK